MPQEANELWGLLASMLKVVEFNCEAGQIIKTYYVKELLYTGMQSPK